MEDGAIDFYPPCHLLTVHCNKQLSAGTLGVELCSGHSCCGSYSECWQAGAGSVHMQLKSRAQTTCILVSCTDHIHTRYTQAHYASRCFMCNKLLTS